jgi:MFS family permease
MQHPDTDHAAEAPTDAIAIWLLALGQTLGYAALLYIFAALLVAWEAGLGWSKAQLALGPSLSIVVSAACAPLAGRLVDRGNGAELLWGGAGLGALALAALSQVETPAQFVAVWAVIGVAHAACLYEVCFAVLIRRLGTGARAAIINVTLMAGFASTLAFPLGAVLAGAFGWRGAVLAFAGLLAFGALPANLVAGRRLRRGTRGRAAPGGETPAQARAAWRAALRGRAFWLLAAVFTLIATNHAMLVSYFIPVFTDRGASPALAVAAASCVGPAQVAGRLALMLLGEARLGTARATGLMLGSLIAAGAVLWVAGWATGLILAFAALQGVAVGLMSILKPVLTAEALGRAGFGAVAGAMAVGPLLGGAAAPFLGALVLDGAGATGLIAVTWTMALAAAGCALMLLATQRRRG